jgi:DNA-binding MurR/RpiR family transcriptional regulator
MKSTPKKHFAPAQAGCLIRIKSAMESFKPSERAVGEFAVENPEKVMHMSISEASQSIGVGESTIIRFCRSLGYKGYQDFKLRLAQDLVEPVQQIHENVSFSDKPKELAMKVFQTNRQAVEDTMRSLDPDMVDVAAKLLTGARRIDIYGIGYSSFTAQDAKLKLTRLDLMADAYGDAHGQAMAAALLRKGDVAIGISHSGSTNDVVDALSRARKSGATTIAITNYSPSPITKFADIVLLTAAPESAFGGEVLSSRIAQLCVIDLLSVSVAITIGEKCLKLIEKTSDAVMRKRY